MSFRVYNPGTKDLLMHLLSGDDLVLVSRKVTPEEGSAPLADSERTNDQLRSWLVSGAVEKVNVEEEQTDG